MRQTCKECKWFYKKEDEVPNLPLVVKVTISCYWKGKWRKWLKKDSEDKPNDCINFEV